MKRNESRPISPVSSDSNNPSCVGQRLGEIYCGCDDDSSVGKC